MGGKLMLACNLDMNVTLFSVDGIKKSRQQKNKYVKTFGPD